MVVQNSFSQIRLEKAKTRNIRIIIWSRVLSLQIYLVIVKCLLKWNKLPLHDILLDLRLSPILFFYHFVMRLGTLCKHTLDDL